LCQENAQLEPGRELAHRTLVLRFIDAGIDQDRAGAGLSRVAAVLGKASLELSGAHVIGVGCVRIRIDTIALLHRLPHFDVALHHDIEHALIFICELVLVELAEPHARLQHDLACAGFEFAAQDLHKRGLAATVRPDQPIAVAAAKLEGNILEEWLGFKLNGEVGCNEHDVSG
jgi:hypothetical protein